MASNAYDIAKAGWLYRQSSVLRRWKKQWFTLDRQGDLRYFEDPDTPRAEERIVVRASVAHINCGRACRSTEAPDSLGYTKDAYLELVMRDNKDNILLCAESVDDMRAWQIALEEARTLTANTPYPNVVNTTTYVGPPGYQPYPYYHTGYTGYNYPGQIISTNGYPAQQVTQVVGGPQGTTTIVNGQPQQIVYVDDGPHYHRRRRHYRGGIFPVPLFFW